MARAGGVYILDVSSDYDHNRTVVSLAGLPVEVEKALFAGIECAADLIDLDQHIGEHPRFGATDVVPIIPIRDITLEQCISIAQRLGSRVARELHMPVYFYEAAAMRKEHRNLANIRRPSFQYEDLKAVISTDPHWMPDVGPAELGKAGACIIGAREALIAYNVFLNTDNLEIARKIARAIRHSSGGLRYVKSTAFMVNGLAQVSLNLTNFRETPIQRVMEMIRSEAQRYGVGILSSELIGLVPQDALWDSASWYLQLDNFSSDSVLEVRIQQAEADLPLAIEEPPIPDDATTHFVPTIDTQAQRPDAFADAIASPTITPAGGAVAAAGAALAAALAEMVSGLTIGKRGYADVEGNMLAIRATAATLRHELLNAIQADSDAFNALMDAIRLPKSHTERDALIQKTSLRAAEIPLETIRLAYESLQLLHQVAELGNHNAAIDAAVGAQMAQAAIEGAALNVRINLLVVADDTTAQRYLAEMNQLLEASRQLTPLIVQVASGRVGLPKD